MRCGQPPRRSPPVTGDLVAHRAKLPDHSVDTFSLSNVTSCIGQGAFDALMLRLRAPTGRHARCYRNFLAEHQVPEATTHLLR